MNVNKKFYPRVYKMQEIFSQFDKLEITGNRKNCHWSYSRLETIDTAMSSWPFVTVQPGEPLSRIASG